MLPDYMHAGEIVRRVCTGSPRSRRTSMSADRDITLYHAPHTRSSGTLVLLEEIGAP
jgi:hypothetical protein